MSSGSGHRRAQAIIPAYTGFIGWCDAAVSFGLSSVLAALANTSRPNLEFPAMLMRNVPVTPVVFKTIKVLESKKY